MMEHRYSEETYVAETTTTATTTTTQQTPSYAKEQTARRDSGVHEQRRERVRAISRTAASPESPNAVDEFGSPRGKEEEEEEEERKEKSLRPPFRKSIGSASASFANWVKGRKSALSLSPSSSPPAERTRTRNRTRTRARTHAREHPARSRSNASGNIPWLPKDASDEVIESVITSLGPEAYDRAFRKLDVDEFETMLAKHARLAGRIYKEELNGGQEGIMGENAEWRRHSR